MTPHHEREAFAPTQPSPEHQELLRKQRRWAKPPYRPNYIPATERIMSSLIGMTWIGWSVIGILSGHMFFLISRRGPIHFSGIPALLFSAAVLAGAAAVLVKIIDHYDRRDNEEAYRRAKRGLWCAVVVCFLLCAGVGCAERLGLLPYTDGRVGMLATPGLKSLLASGWVSQRLAPHSAELLKWSLILGAWCLGGFVVLSKLGLIKENKEPSLGIGVFFFLFLVLPALGAFTLFLAATVSGEPYPGATLSDEATRARIAWQWSMLLSCVGALLLVLFVLAMGLLRMIGVLPKV